MLREDDDESGEVYRFDTIGGEDRVGCTSIATE